MPPRTKKPETLAKYPRVSVAVCARPEKSGVSAELAEQLRSALAAIGLDSLFSYNPPLTYLDAVTLFGAEWQVDGGPLFGSDYLFLDRYGKKVRASNNVRNRPLYVASVVEPRVQDILMGRWELNGEPGIIGRDGIVLDFQHTLTALILAYQDWKGKKDPDGNLVWADRWPEAEFPNGPVIDKIIVYGIENSDRVVNTINTGRPRSLSDVLYRSPFFEKLPVRDAQTNMDRTTASKVMQSALQAVWRRTGMGMIQRGSIMNHSEAMAWIDHHGGTKSKLLEAVRHVLENNQTGRITQFVSLGYAATMCWLMGQSGTEPDTVEKYYSREDRSGKGLNWDNWGKALKFWEEFGRTEYRDVQGTEARFKVGDLAELTGTLDVQKDLEEGSGGRGREKDYAIVTGWRAYRDTGVIEPDSCNPVYKAVGTKMELAWTPSERCVGGIDLGNEKATPNPNDGISPEPDPVVSAPDVGHEPRPEPPPAPTVPDGARSVVEVINRVRADNAEYSLVLVKNHKGCVAWAGECQLLGLYTTKKPKMDPRGIVAIRFSPEETQELADKLTTDKMTVAVVSEVLVQNGEQPYVVETVYRPAKVKGKK